MIVGTAGHIDHGKTALVKALTGVDTDRLAEEKARGITIDLGYAYTAMASGEILGFVDVPGHERFIHNMLAGATGIDCVLLVVAADDGIMPQTVEHLQIADLLGISHGAVALTKSDRVDAERLAAVGQDLHSLLDGTRMADAPIFPVSAVSGVGVPALRSFLEEAAATVSARAPGGGFRLAVDRCFTVAGAGTVATGTVFSGQVAQGDHLLLSPSGRPVRVRGIHAQNRAAETAHIGQRCALNLAGVEKPQVQRGDWVLAPELHRPTLHLDVWLTLLASETAALRQATRVHVHVGTHHTTGRVTLLQRESLGPGHGTLARLVLERPTSAVRGDRCILRDASAMRTVAGGLVLDAHPPARGRRSAQRLAALTAWQQTDPQAMLRALLQISPVGVDLGEFAANANLTGAEADRLCLAPAVLRVEGPKPVVFTPFHWASLRRTVIETLQQTHSETPDALGLNAEQLRLRTAPRLDRSIFARLLSELLEAGECVRDGSWWHLPGHQITLGDGEEALWRRVAPRLTETPFQPPRVRDIARALTLEEATVRRLLTRVARGGQVYKLAHDHYFDRAAVVRLSDIFRELAREAPDGGVTAASFRDRIDTGRKLAVQILEYFDRVGLTRRLKDTHRLRDESLRF